MPSRFGGSMIVFNAMKTLLVSKQTALVLAQSVARDYFGADDLAFQSPLVVTDGEDHWAIEGTPDLDPEMERDVRTRRGRLRMAISKFNAEILKLEH